VSQASCFHLASEPFLTHKEARGRAGCHHAKGKHHMILSHFYGVLLNLPLVEKKTKQLNLMQYTDILISEFQKNKLPLKEAGVCSSVFIYFLQIHLFYAAQLPWFATV